MNAGLGLVNTVFVAYFFGTARAVEVYLAAVGLYASVVSLAQTGQVSEVLLPSYHALREQHGRNEAFQAYSALTNRFVLILAGFALVSWFAAPLLSSLRVPGFGAADISLATSMFRWIVPLVVLQVAADLLKTLANAERLFGTPEIISIFARILSLIALVLLSSRVGPWALVASLWCAGIAEITGIVWLLGRCGFRYRPTLAVPESAIKVRLFGKLAATLPYVGMTQLYLFVLDAALSHLVQGNFAVFRYATTIWSRTQGVFLRPVSVTFFTQFSESAARGTNAGAALTEKALGHVLAISAIVTTAVLTGVGPVLAGLWQGDRFPPHQITTLVWLLGGLYVLLPIVGVSTILRKAAVSMHLVRATYVALAFVQMFSALVAWLVVPPFGLAGALTVSAVNLMGFWVAPLAVLRLAGSPLIIRYPFGAAWRWLVAVLGGVGAGMLAHRVIGSPEAGSDWIRAAEVAVGCSLAGFSVAVAFGLSLAFKVPESRQLAAALVKFVGRVRT